MRSHLQQRIEARVVYARQRLVLDTENRVLARGLSVAQIPLLDLRRGRLDRQGRSSLRSAFKAITAACIIDVAYASAFGVVDIT